MDLERDHEKVINEKAQYEEELNTLVIGQSDEDKFHCKLIKGDCPYVKLIKNEFDLVERRKEELTKKISSLSIEKDTKAFSSLEEKMKELESQIDTTRLLFKKVDRKAIQDNALLFAQTQTQITKLSDELTTFENEMEQQATAKEKQAKLQATIEAKQEQLDQLTTKQNTSQELLQQYRDQVNTHQLDQIVRVEK